MNYRDFQRQSSIIIFRIMHAQCVLACLQAVLCDAWLIIDEVMSPGWDACSNIHSITTHCAAGKHWLQGNIV